MDKGRASGIYYDPGSPYLLPSCCCESLQQRCGCGTQCPARPMFTDFEGLTFMPICPGIDVWLSQGCVLPRVLISVFTCSERWVQLCSTHLKPGAEVKPPASLLCNSSVLMAFFIYSCFYC